MTLHVYTAHETIELKAIVANLLNTDSLPMGIEQHIRRDLNTALKHILMSNTLTKRHPFEVARIRDLLRHGN